MSKASQNSHVLVDSVLNESYCRFLGVRAAKVESDKVRLELPYRDEVSNPGRQVHGGVMSSMLGVAGRAAALSQTQLTPPVSAASAELNVTYLSSAVGEGMIATGEVLRRGRELTHVHCALATEADKPLATAMVIFRTVPGVESPPSPLTIERGAPPQTELPSIARALSGAPFISALGIRVNRFEGGRAELAMPFRADICGGDGALHEGGLGALVDTAGALSAWSMVKPKPGMKVSTVSIDVNFCSSIRDSSAIAYSHVVTRRNELFFNRVDVLTPDGTPIALGNVIYRIVLPV